MTSTGSVKASTLPVWLSLGPAHLIWFQSVMLLKSTLLYFIDNQLCVVNLPLLTIRSSTRFIGVIVSSSVVSQLLTDCTPNVVTKASSVVEDSNQRIC